MQDNSSKKKKVSEDETAGPPHAGEESKKLKHGTSVDNLSLCCSLLCTTYICFSDTKPHEICFIVLEIKHLLLVFLVFGGKFKRYLLGLAGNQSAATGRPSTTKKRPREEGQSSESQK